MHLGSWRRNPLEGNRQLTYLELADELGDYVADLGFTHVELLPVMEHPFGGSWGYQVTGYFAPTSRFGTPDDFRTFVDRLHQRGIGVLLDWVPAHFPRDEWALAQFDGTALYEHADPRRGSHPDWGTLVFNLGRREVRNFLYSNALYWMREHHADGIRVDAVASMLYLDYSRKAGEWLPNEFGGREDLDAVEFLKELNEVLYAREPGVISSAEESTAWPGVSRPTYLGGLGFGFKWNMGWMHDTLAYFKKDPVYRRFHHHTLTFSLMYAFSENFVLPLSHDEVVHGKGSLLAKMPGDRWQKFANLRSLYAYMWAHPGKKLLFMGGELAEWDEWNDGGSLHWNLLEYAEHQGVHSLVRDLNRVYRDTPALWEVDFEPAGFRWLEANDASGNVLAFARLDAKGERPLVCVLNLSPVPRYDYRVGMPVSGRWREALNTDSPYYGGTGVGNLGAVEAAAVPWHDQPFSALAHAAAARRLWLVPESVMFTTRPELRGTFGMVASTHWLASAAGMAVLEQGGNAFDAAVAAGLTLQVVEPNLNGPGGDLPAILFPVERGEPVVLCAQGPAPRAATIAHYRDELGLSLVPGTGPLAAVVPGAFGGWMAMLRDYGTLPFAEVAKYAIHYAEHGYPVVPAITRAVRNVEQLFRDEWTTSAEVYLPVPEPGGLHRNPQLAQTYRRLAESDDPVEEWYRGFVADAIVGFQQREWMDSSGERHAGLLAEEDLRDWQRDLRGAARRRLPGAVRAEGGAVEPGAGLPPAAAPARGLRPRRDGTRVRRVRPHRHRVREARVRRPRGLVRRSRLRRRPARRAALAGVRRRAARARRRRFVAGAAARLAGRPRAAARRARRGDARRARRRRADARRHRPSRRRRPLGEHGRRDAERRLALGRAGDPGARLLSRDARADVLARGGPAELAGAGEAAAHDAVADDGASRTASRISPSARPAATSRTSGRCTSCSRTFTSTWTCRPRSTRRTTTPRRSRARSTRARRCRATSPSRSAPARRRSTGCARAATTSRCRRRGRSAA